MLNERLVVYSSTDLRRRFQAQLQLSLAKTHFRAQQLEGF